MPRSLHLQQALAAKQMNRDAHGPERGNHASSETEDKELGPAGHPLIREEPTLKEADPTRTLPVPLTFVMTRLL